MQRPVRPIPRRFCTSTPAAQRTKPGREEVSSSELPNANPSSPERLLSYAWRRGGVKSPETSPTAALGRGKCGGEGFEESVLPSRPDGAANRKQASGHQERTAQAFVSAESYQKNP